VTCFLSQVTLQLTLESFSKAVCISLTCSPMTWREVVEEDCQSAIYKATRLGIGLGPITSHVETDCVIQNHHISDSSHPFSVCFCRRTCLLQAAHFSRAIILQHICCCVEPFVIPCLKDTTLLHAIQGRFATTKVSRDSACLYPCTNRLKKSLSTLNVMNFTNCTPASHL